jgi:hypothetical protein
MRGLLTALLFTVVMLACTELRAQQPALIQAAAAEATDSGALWLCRGGRGVAAGHLKRLQIPNDTGARLLDEPAAWPWLAAR